LRVRVTTAQEISGLYGTQSGHVQLMRSRTLSSAIAATTRSIVSAAEAYCAADVTSSKSGASRGEPTDSQRARRLEPRRHDVPGSSATSSRSQRARARALPRRWAREFVRSRRQAVL
jgi:hypothetical protein